MVAAVVSSTSVGRARAFLTGFGALNANAYCTYEELGANPNVDIIFVATPHLHHFQDCLLALDTNKPVICEKPFTGRCSCGGAGTVNITKKGLFLIIKVVWMRRLLVSLGSGDLVKSGKIGEASRAVVDLALT